MSLLVEKICEQFRKEWSSGRPDLSAFLSSLSENDRREVAPHLIEIDVSHRARAGEQPVPDDYQQLLSKEELSRLSDVFSPDVWSHSTGTQALEKTVVKNGTNVTTNELTTIGDRYRVLGTLGEGAFGMVYRAFDEGPLGREVAIKIPLTCSDEHVAVLLKEANAAAQLRHTNVVTVLDCGILEDGRCFVVFELIEGGSLADEIRKGPITADRAIDLAIAIAKGVHHAHLANLFHRDLKPANILIDTTGEPLVTDFGLAITSEQQIQAEQERSGTPSYMSPEQVDGNVDMLDGRSDIWSLGIILYEMVTGTRPFVGKTQDQLYNQIRTREPRPFGQFNSVVPKNLEAICLKCLRRDPAKRYSTAKELAADLTRLRRELAGPAKPETSLQATREHRLHLSDELLVPEQINAIENKEITEDDKHQRNRRRITIVFFAGLVTVVAAAIWGGLFETRRIDNLLKDKPEIFSWRRTPASRTPLHDEEEEAYTIRGAEFEHFAIVGDEPNEDFNFRTVISVWNWVGTAGVAWGLEDVHGLPEKSKRCFGVVFSRPVAFRKPQIRLVRFTFSTTEGVVWTRTDTELISNIPVSLPVGLEAVLFVRVESEGVRVFLGQTDLGTFRPPVGELWRRGRKASLLVVGAGDDLTFSNLTVEAVR